MAKTRQELLDEIKDLEDKLEDAGLMRSASIRAKIATKQARLEGMWVDGQEGYHYKGPENGEY